jgi:hypothetical protein
MHQTHGTTSSGNSAGGAGERLYPLTRDLAKPAVPFGGTYRLIDVTRSNCVNSGLRRVYILTQHKALSLNRHIRATWHFLPPELGALRILFTYKKRESGERIAVCLVAARSTPTFAAARRLGVPSIVPGIAIGDRVLRWPRYAG